jgi:type IV secretory pathway VirB6-like protein
MIHKSYKKNKTNLRNTYKKRDKKGGNGNNKSNTNNFIFPSKKISTQHNFDSNYEEIGIVHVTESTAINAIRGVVTGLANIFGSKGFENSVYDIARNSALQKLTNQITANQKISNLRMEASFDQSLVFIHLYGTLLEKKTSKSIQAVQAVQAVQAPQPQVKN